jgi:hypothetical protein
MSLFRPVNSSESNLYTIRLTIGIDSPVGVFKTGTTSLPTNSIIASNDSSNPITVNHLSSPSYSNLPRGFYLKYIISGSTRYFQVVYGKEFTEQPNVSIIPHSGLGNFSGFPIIQKKSLSSTTNNLTFQFINQAGATIGPSTNGNTGLLGFDLIITGPVKIGITTGNSNKGWALSDSTTVDPTTAYTYMDVNLGSGYSLGDSVIISKNLKLLNNKGEIKTYTSSTSTLDYNNTIWIINGSINLTNLIPVKGMILMIISDDTNFSGTSYTSNPTVTLGTDCRFNFQNQKSLTFTKRGDSIMLYGTSSLNFVILNMSSSITLS